MKTHLIVVLLLLNTLLLEAETTIVFNKTITKSWDNGTHSIHRRTSSSSYHNAKYYTFRLDRALPVKIDLQAAQDTHLFLLKGGTRHGEAIAEDDDGGSGVNSQIRRTLSKGTYTIEATTHYTNKLGRFQVRVSVPVTSSSTVKVFFGEDLSPNGHINSDRAKQQFFSHLISPGTEDFEAYSDGETAPLTVNFGASGSAVLTGAGNVEDGETSANQKPTSGSKFWLANSGDFTINFTKPISAFGFYGTDIGDFGGSLILNYSDGTNKSIYVGNSVTNNGSTSSSTLYFGFIEKDLRKAFRSITFENTYSGSDVFGFDDITIARAAQIGRNKYIVKNDFNRDGIADILMRNKYTGQYSIHYMLRNGSRGRYQYGLNVPLKFSIVGTNDFNGDGIADILWRDKSTGQYAIYYMLASGHRGRYQYGPIVPKYYSVQDTNDFNGDGIADIIWRNNNTGQYLIYYMLPNGKRGRYKFGSVVPKQYVLIDTNDFNGDGIADILWRNKQTGQYLIFFMNADGSRKSYKFGTKVPTKYAFLDSNDFNGDGLTDIIWRNKHTGQYLIFYMNANGQRVRYKYGITVPRTWGFKATGDYNKDGIADILWRNRDNGQYLIYFMKADGNRKSYKYGFIIPEEMKIELK